MNRKGVGNRQKDKGSVMEGWPSERGNSDTIMSDMSGFDVFKVATSVLPTIARYLSTPG